MAVPRSYSTLLSNREIAAGRCDADREAGDHVQQRDEDEQEEGCRCRLGHQDELDQRDDEHRRRQEMIENGAGACARGLEDFKEQQE